MVHQSEAILENNLIQQLLDLGYDSVQIKDGDALLSNLKRQLEIFNKTSFSAKEFDAVLNHLAKGNVFEKAKTLRDRFNLLKGDGTNFYVRFFDNENVSNNIYQVSNQVEQQGSFLNRYDVTLLVNGLPLVQIELKRSGIEIKEAFNKRFNQKYQSPTSFNFPIVLNISMSFTCSFSKVFLNNTALALGIKLSFNIQFFMKSMGLVVKFWAKHG